RQREKLLRGAWQFAVVAEQQVELLPPAENEIEHVRVHLRSDQKREKRTASSAPRTATNASQTSAYKRLRMGSSAFITRRKTSIMHTPTPAKITALTIARTMG